MLKYFLPVLALVVLFVPSLEAQCFQSAPACGTAVVQTGYVVQNDGDFNLSCAIQAGNAVIQCRESGGRFLQCAFTGFASYVSCNGGLAGYRQARLSIRSRTRSFARSRIRCR